MILTSFPEKLASKALTKLATSIGACHGIAAMEALARKPIGYRFVKSASMPVEDHSMNRALCIMAKGIFDNVEDSKEMPVYYMFKSAAAAGGGAKSAIAASVGAAAVRRWLAATELESLKTAGVKSTVLSLLGGSAAAMPTAAKAALAIAALTGAVGGGIAWHVNDSTSRDASKVDVLKRQAEVTRRMRDEINQQVLQGGVTGIEYK